MRFNILFTFFLAIFTNCLVAQNLNSIGNPFITNFTPETYNGSEQTWCIAQDDRGVMYFGTESNGVVEYDGTNWRKISVLDNKPVYSLAKGDDGKIYVGTSGDFGYLEPNEYGKLEYKSLAVNLPDSIKTSFSLILKTYSLDGSIYFCTFIYIFKYDGKNLTPIYLGNRSTTGNFLTFLVNNTIYVGSYFKGLVKYKEDGSYELAPGAKNFKEKDIYNIIKLNDTRFLVVTTDGYYNYNPITGETFELDDSYGNLKKIRSQSMLPYHSVLLNNNNIGVGMVQSDYVSFLEISKDGNPLNIYNRDIGIQGSQITYLFQNNDNPLWLTLFDGGLSKVEINSSFRRFAKESGNEDIINDIISFEGVIYIATFNGVYYINNQPNEPATLKPVENITGLVWDLAIFSPPNSKPMLLAGTYINGIYEIKNKKAISISEPLRAKFPDVQHNVFFLYQSKRNPETLYIGKNHGLSNLVWSNGKWSRTENLFKDQINGEVRSLIEDKHGNLWLYIISKGLRVINTKNNIVDLSNSKEFENNKELYFFDNSDSLLFITSNGVYKYNYTDSSFVKGGLPSPYNNDKGVAKIQKTKKGFLLTCFNNTEKHWIELLEKDSTDLWTVNTIPFKRLPNKWIDATYVDENGIIWIGISKELYSYNPNNKRNYSNPFRALIRKVVAKDSLLFDGYLYSINEEGKKVFSAEQQPIQHPKLSYRYNGIVINFSAPFYEKEGEIQYSHYLEGSDETTWSKWDGRTEATYTNLREGKYTFHVKAINIYDNESIVASYSFEIRPPWFRTIIAYFLYIVLIVVLVWGIVKWNTRRLIAEKEHLEQIVKERTAEVVAQKEEIEVQNEKIAAQNEEIKSSIQYASRIQGAILTPPDQVNRIFPENFILYLPRDIVSGDFYYITQVGNKRISVVADCTGHGVPGGFMSMLGVSFLTQIISQTEDLSAATILNKLRHQVITALHQTGEIGGSKDGMDIALYIFDDQTMKLQFAGANNPLIHISNGELNHIKSDKMPIGIHIRGDVPFTNFELDVKKGDVIYTFSDGYADQFGGGDARKFMIKNLKDLLLEIHQKPMDEQRDILDKTLLNWHGDTPRIDDVVVMGMRV